MSRPKRDPVDRAVDAYEALSTHEKEVFIFVVKRLNQHTSPPPRRRTKPQPAAVPEPSTESNG